MLLYHFTTPIHLPRIAEDGFLKVTESNIGAPPNKSMEPTGEHAGPDVVWLTNQDGTQTNRDTLRAGCVLSAGSFSVLSVDKTVVRFTVDVPDDEVLRWADFAKAQGIHKRWQRVLEKWPAKPNWWFLIERPVPSGEWVEICSTYGEEMEVPTALAPKWNLHSAISRSE